MRCLELLVLRNLLCALENQLRHWPGLCMYGEAERFDITQDAGRPRYMWPNIQGQQMRRRLEMMLNGTPGPGILPRSHCWRLFFLSMSGFKFTKMFWYILSYLIRTTMVSYVSPFSIHQTGGRVSFAAWDSCANCPEWPQPLRAPADPRPPRDWPCFSSASPPGQMTVVGAAPCVSVCVAPTGRQ